MSGRVHTVLADGRSVIGYRKTLARRPRLTPQERTLRHHDRCTKRFPSKWVSDVRLGFLLPKHPPLLIADGPHGHNINVLRGFVQIQHGSAEECFLSAEKFFFDVARGSAAFHVLACITSKALPGRHYWRELCVVNGGMVVASDKIEPKIFTV